MDPFHGALSTLFDVLGQALEALQAQLPPTVTVIEILWTGPAALGLARYLWRYHKGWLARSAALRNPRLTAAERLVTEARCVRFLSLAFAFWGFLAFGIRSMLYPQAPDFDLLDPEYWVPAVILLAVEVSLFVKGEVLDRYDRGVRRLYLLDHPPVPETPFDPPKADPPSYLIHGGGS